MARLHVRSGLDPDEPDTPAAALVVDPEGTPGEQALERLGGHCYEGDEVLYLVQTDGWAEHSYDGGLLTVAVAVHPAVLERAEIDPAGFPLRSAADPAAVLVLRAETAVAPAVAERLAEGAAVLLGPPDTPLDDLLGPDGDWPIILAGPPQP
ncbi:hypothetical protein [Kitasatospora sp. MY 5-36]|uniref:hypothetical protein n=1 Tax=Kitasatospora sp. MY 5-36 TaxID=1678027 RepID=UPI0006716C10|nr:hypothetical protein [Kitasatospora sp. MY 5-36]